MPTSPFAELVFGFVYPVGTDADPVVNVFKDYLQQYLYRSTEFRISDQLRKLNLGLSLEDLSPYEKMKALMDAGNLACCRDPQVLAAMAIRHIAAQRDEDEDGRTKPLEHTAHIIRSLKRPDEVRLLREIYRPGFFLIGIAEDDDSQKNYLTEQKGLTDAEAKLLVERDQDEHLPNGQRTRETFYLSDVFVQRTDEAYKGQLLRFLDLVFGHPFRTPSREEHAMFMAYASAARSAQLGRQVGSAIATPDGDVIAVGMNEVPSPKGGPYWEGDGKEGNDNPKDQRDHEQEIDSNFQQRDQIVKSIVANLDGKLFSKQLLSRVAELLSAELGLNITTEQLSKLEARCIEQGVIQEQSETRNLIHSSELKHITEYGRAVHGEMDAILSCVRRGVSVQGKYLFVTTFPCHNCTRHIIASGIKKVFYIEPYPKSKARDLHSDAICFSESEAGETGRIPFLPFVGVGPRRYLDLFSLELSSGRKISRKDDNGKPVIPDKPKRPPRVPMTHLSYLEREDKVLDDFKDEWLRLEGVQHVS